MFEELLWVHSFIRRDLIVVEQLAADGPMGFRARRSRTPWGSSRQPGRCGSSR